MANLQVQKNQGAQAITQNPRTRDPFQSLRELMRWEPFAELSRGWPGEAMDFAPAFEVKETPSAYVFKADVPGVKESDIEVTLQGNRLTIGGKRDSEKQEQNDKFYSYERSFGRFMRSFTLPEGINAEQCGADLKDGVLTVSVPKNEEVKTQRVAVRTAEKSEGDKAKA
jgi:HSP20 family protein